MSWPHTAATVAPFARLIAMARLLVPALTLCFVSVGCSTAKQVEFASPDVAAQSLVSALRINDQAQLKAMLGSETNELLSSGDAVADQRGRQKFLDAYDQKHQLVPNSTDPTSVSLVVGPRDWPLPMPIVQDDKTGKWYFDADAGIEEIINRRIGRNELDVIQVCEAIVDAQQEYATRDPNKNGIPEFATKFVSDPGTRNGLYWDASPDEPLSPLGPFIADAVEQGYTTLTTASAQPRPYHGYFYRMLKSQSSNAPGGAMDYEVNGLMIGGFAVVAYPSDYDNSGIMSFMVCNDGVVYQKDLGSETLRLAKAMTVFDPGLGWAKVESPAATAPTSAGH